MQSFINRYLREYTWYGLFAGIVLSVFAINLLFFLSQLETIFLWYALYTISLGVFHWAYTGVGFQWLWPDHTIWNRYSYMVASFLLLSFQYIYMYRYTRQLNPVNKGYVIAIISIRLVILIITLANPGFSRWHLFLDFMTIAFQLWLSWKVSLHKTVHGSLYMFSISLLVGCYLIFIASYYGFITASFYVYNSIAVGGICELIVGMVALSLRYKYISDEKNKLQVSEIESLKAIGELKEKVLEESQEKERIQREVNKDLEVKIQARTIELAQKNEKLEELNAKLLEMSSQLDKQNWSLNKELQGDRLKLMWGKDISFEEFKQTFPSDKHIFRFIADLKWQDGFVCKKCQSNDYTEGAQYLSRKCTHCKYEESVTAHTLFHGVKFPLVQALYISLHTVIHRETVPVKQLAEDIDLREATVWAFRKKTMERITAKNLSKGDVLRSLVG
ncbi:MAG: hypothetical protein K2Q22_15980 [Cytophagales bacterium]|nr:hypothetical protein [Cytophagales bacterium]